MTSRRLAGPRAWGLSRRRFLASTGAAAWCGACSQPLVNGTLLAPPAPPVPLADADGATEASAESPPTSYETYADPAKDWAVQVLFHRCHLRNALPAELLEPAVPGSPPASCPGGAHLGEEPAPGHGAGVPRHVLNIWTYAHEILVRYCGTPGTRRPPTDRQEPLFPHPGCIIIHLLDLSAPGYRAGAAPKLNLIALHHVLTGRDAQATLAHEIFHRIQFTYNRRNWASFPAPQATDQGKPGRFRIVARDSLLEGGARVAEAVLVPGSDRYLEDAAIWFADDRYSLFAISPHPRGRPAHNDYAAGLFWKYVAEQHGRSPSGLDTQMHLLRNIATAPEPEQHLPPTCTDPPSSGGPPFRFTPGMLRGARAAMRGPGHFDRMAWERRGGAVSSETTWGNFVMALALNGTPQVDSRFVFRDAGRWQAGDAPRLRIPPERQFVLDALPLSVTHQGVTEFSPAEETMHRRPDLSDRLREWARPALSGGGSIIRQPLVALLPYAFEAWEIDCRDAEGGTLLRVRFRGVDDDRPGQKLDHALVQIALLDRSSRLVDAVRFASQGTDWHERVVRCDGIETALILVAAGEAGGNYELALSRATKRPLLFATPWNAPRGRHLSADPRQQAWSWRSPDFYPTLDRKDIVLRVSNLGTGRAEGVRCRLLYKNAGPDFYTAPWQMLAPFPRAADNQFNGAPGDGFYIDPPPFCSGLAQFRENACRPEETFRFAWPAQLDADRSAIMRAEITCDNNAEAGPLNVMASVWGTPPPPPAGEEGFSWQSR